MTRLRDHGLSIFFGAIFVLALVGQSIAGASPQRRPGHARRACRVVAEFVTESEFVVDVAENWQSEYLQFFLFIAATVWLVHVARRSRRSRVTKERGPTSSSWSAVRPPGLTVLGQGRRMAPSRVLQLAAARHGWRVRDLLAAAVASRADGLQRGAEHARAAADRLGEY